MPVTSPRASARAKRHVDLDRGEGGAREHLRLIAEAVNQLFAGKITATGTVTLTASQTTTTLTHTSIGPASVILFMPTTADAAGEVGMYVSARGKQTATMTHMSDARTTRTFAYAVLG